MNKGHFGAIGRGILAALLVCAAAAPPVVRSESLRVPADHHPGICSGYLEGLWSSFAGWRSRPDCPRGHAFYNSFYNKTWIKGQGATLPAEGTCCPLPAGDILLAEQQVQVSEECPDNWVATGAQNECLEPQCRKLMRCTKINTERYQLGPKKPGMYWGFGAKWWRQRDQIIWEDIPAAIRYGFGRFDIDRWAYNGCLGLPFGSLLVQKRSLECSGRFYRQLQYRGMPGDPPAGTPVQMFAECDDLSDIFAEHPLCIKYPREIRPEGTDQ